MFADTPIDTLPRTHSRTISRFKSLNIYTYWDLINHFPSRYEDYSHVSRLTSLRSGEMVTIEGHVLQVKQLITQRGLRMQQINVQNANGIVECRWFNQSYLLTLFKPGMRINVSGQIQMNGKKPTMNPLEYELIQPAKPPLHTARIVPIYPETRGLSSRTIREKLYPLLDREIPDTIEFLPHTILEKYKLISEPDAYRQIHFPRSTLEAELARKRLSIDELLLMRLSSILIRRAWESNSSAHAISVDEQLNKIEAIKKGLPFELTKSQQRAIKEIFTDLSKSSPMNRFLQGDVGSGKTVVAALACYVVALSKLQSLIMTPTEILAKQHFETIQKLVPDVKVCLLTKSTKPSKKELTQSEIIIGTQALIQKKILFGNVGLVVIDEQHRFGVNQRAILKKKGDTCHLLTMTATPIPRTVALTLYGELEMSVLSELPPNRKPIQTFYVPPEKRAKAYPWIRKQIQQYKSQAYVVCPLVEESDHESMKSVKAATREFERLKVIFPELSLALIHGKLKSNEKDTVMTEFASGRYDILVATSVIEVGVDVPNATIMLIEGADHYGLAQLHQLRGRVGRGAKRSYCMLFSDQPGENARKRLNFFAQVTNGMQLAEYDLKARGAGEIYGLRQHGVRMLKIANLTDDRITATASEIALNLSKNSKLMQSAPLQARLERLNVKTISRD